MRNIISCLRKGGELTFCNSHSVVGVESVMGDHRIPEPDTSTDSALNGMTTECVCHRTTRLPEPTTCTSLVLKETTDPERDGSQGTAAT